MTDPGPAGPPYAVPVGHSGGAGGPAPQEMPLSPPPGPGVAPPFAAPPTEGRTARLWTGLGVGALAVVLCCGGGVAALVGLVVASTEAANEQARTVVGDYLDAVTDKEYGEAYALLCDQIQRRESSQAFARRVSAEPEITAYRIGELANDFTVPVDVTYATNNRRTLRFTLTTDSDDGQLEVCGIR